MKKLLLGSLAFAIIILIWCLVSYTNLVSKILLPYPVDVLKAGYILFAQDNFANDLGISCFRILAGFFISVVIAVPLGILIGLNKKIEVMIEPIIDFIRYTPIPAFIPLFILWFGIGENEKILVIFASVFFQLVLMIANSTSNTPKNMIEFAHTLGASKKQIIHKVIWPYSKPKIFDDMRVSMGWAWSGVILAEIVGASSGMGYVIIQAQRLLQTVQVFWVIIIIGILGIITDKIFKISRCFFFPWYDKKNYAKI